MLDKIRDELIADDDTVVAVSTAPGRGGIGIVRVSGTDAMSIVDRLFRSPGACVPRRARLGTFGPPKGPVVDQVVVTLFQAPQSYTGEDVVEISAHGNPLILNEIEALIVSSGARRARRGEFTLRAVSNGKMDLAQAEAVRDFVAAQTEAQARSALQQMQGAVANRVQPEKDALVAVVAELEAGIDFADDDIEPPLSGDLAERIDAIAGHIRVLAESFDYGKLLTGGLLLAIVGRPNVGKSSLFNRLISVERAIVTDIPGTTRDVLTETVNISGVPIRVADTAGIRRTSETIEAMGVERSLETLAEADLTLVVLDGSQAFTAEDRALIGRLEGRPLIVVVNKCDLPAAWDREEVEEAVEMSALTGQGFADLEEAVADWIVRQRPADAEGFVITSSRQKDALVETARHLRHSASELREGVHHELVLVVLYRALSSLGEVTGEVTSEDILGQIFSSFCIGK